MNPNFLSVTFWFNIFDNQESFIDVFSKSLKDEFEEFKYFEENNSNYLKPRLEAYNRKTHNNLIFSKINLQYNMESIDMNKFYDNVLKLYDILIDNNIKILHTAIYVNIEFIKENALNTIARKILTSTIDLSDLVDINLKFGKKYDDIFYKIISLMNKKQIELPRMYDELNREVPLPLISWNKGILKDDVINVSYEINDKLSFDTSSNYFTESAYLNKMLYILKHDMFEDIDNLMNKGMF